MKILENGIAVIDGDTLIASWVETTGRLDHDHSLLPVLRQCIHEGQVVVDIGANIGTMTRIFVDLVGPKGNVHSFEPCKSAFECLRHNMAGLSNVTVYPVALGSGVRSTVRLVCNKENPGANRILCGDDEGCVIETAPMSTLDKFKLKPNFIKIDVEGWEPDVLRGASATIRKCRPMMLIEINREALQYHGFAPSDVYNFLDDHGYLWQPTHGLTPDEPQFDALCWKHT